MTKLKINEHCSIRTKGVLYCLTDLHQFMDMRNDRSSPQYWAANRSGLRIRKMGLFRKVCWVPGCILQRGLFRKTYWAPRSMLVDYAQSLTPGIFKEVRAALGMEDPVVKPMAFSTTDAPKAKPVPSTLDHSKPLRVSREDLFVAPSLPVEQGRVMQDGSRTRRDVETEKMIQQMARRTQPARRSQPMSRSTHNGYRASRNQNDAMMTQMLIMDSVMSEPSRSHRSVDTGSCEAPSRSHSSHSDDSSRHSYSSHSSHDYGSYDSGSSSSDSGGGGGCD